jgi:hypothetical protein
MQATQKEDEQVALLTPLIQTDKYLRNFDNCLWTEFFGSTRSPHK